MLRTERTAGQSQRWREPGMLDKWEEASADRSRVGKVKSEMQWDRRGANRPDYAQERNQGVLP